MINRAKVSLISMILVIGCGFLEAGGLSKVKHIPVRSAEKHYRAGVAAYHDKNWREAKIQFRIVVNKFPASSFVKDAEFFLGETYYNCKNYELADQHIDNYLKRTGHLQYFERAVFLKFAIAESYRKGAHRRLFGWKLTPKLLSGWNQALTIYDEIAVALPTHDVAARALFCKGKLLTAQRNYRKAIETFQSLTKRFPKHEFTPESYLRIARAYVKQSQKEPQNPDILALAEVNAQIFKQHFPGEEHIDKVDEDVMNIQEVHAKGFYDTGLFYERVKKPHASVIYYYNAVKRFPKTHVASACKERLRALQKEFQELFPSEEIF